MMDISGGAFLITIVATLWFSACLQPHRIISRPTIMPNTDWQLVDQSPYVYGGIAKGDHLIGHGLKIRIEALNAGSSPQLVIRLEFLIADQTPIEFIPSLNIVELKPAQSLQATGYECKAALLINPMYRKSQRPAARIVFSDKYNCIDLYFEVAPPSVDDVFKLKIDGISVRGKNVIGPELTFRKGVANW